MDSTAVGALVGRVLTDARELPRSLVSLRDGRIESVREWAGPPPSGALDAGNGWIAAGLIDAQINGAFGQDFADPEADLEVAARGMLAHGVTAFVPTLVTLPWEQYPAAMANLARGARSGAALLGVHLEGPFLQPRYHGAHPTEHLREPLLADVETLLGLGDVRMMTLAAELPGALDAVRSLAKRGVVVSLGHSAATFDQGRVALINGARAGTHLFNAMPPLHHRDPGLAGALLAEARATVGIIADGIHVHPSVLNLAWKMRGTRGLMLVTDAIAAMGMPPGVYPLGARQVRTTRHEARLADGTLAGSMLTLDGAVRGMVQRGGCPLPDAVAMTTEVPARLLGVETERGRVAAGLVADLLVIGPDLRVRCTVQGGRVVYRAEEMSG
jgi:N-acetylglucosamine-6-phosphate deacetylase